MANPARTTSFSVSPKISIVVLITLPYDLVDHMLVCRLIVQWFVSCFES